MPSLSVKVSIYASASNDRLTEACRLLAAAIELVSSTSRATLTSSAATESVAAETSSAIGTLSVVRPSTTFVTTVFGILGGASDVSTGSSGNASPASKDVSADSTVLNTGAADASSTAASGTAAAAAGGGSSGDGLSTGAKAGIGAGVGIGGLLLLVVAFLVFTGRIAITLGKGRRSDKGTGDETGPYSKPELEAIEKKEAKKEATVAPVELPGEEAVHEAPNAPFGEVLHEVSSREVPAELPDAASPTRHAPTDR